MTRFLKPLSFFLLLLGWGALAACATVPPTPSAPPTATAAPELPTPEPSPTADIAQAIGRIALITPSGDLATVNPDGSEERILAQDQGFFQFPAWSPTSNDIAVIGGGRGDTGNVYVVNDTADSELLSIYNATNPIYLYWSPDGQRVGFIARHPRGLALHVAPANGEQSSDILSTGQPLYWQWLADAEQILTHAGRDALAYVDGAGNAEDLALGQAGLFQAPARSADGRYLAYSDEDAEENLAIFVRDIANQETTFTQPHTGILAMSWSPTAAQLAYTNPVENRLVFFGPLHLFDAATGVSQVLVTERVLAFFWSPDGRSIAYITLVGEENQQAKAGGAAKLATQRASDVYLTLKVLDVASGGIRPLHTFQPGLLFLSQFMPFFDQYALSHRIWSPDSAYVVLPTVVDGADEIVVIPVDGRAPLTIAQGLSAFWSQE